MNHFLLLDVLIDDDDSNQISKLAIFANNIKKEVIGVIHYLFFFLTRYDERKAHKILALMLHPRFKRLKLMSSFISHEHDVTTTEKYDRNFFFPCF
jgi:hypothetical protein